MLNNICVGCCITVVTIVLIDGTIMPSTRSFTMKAFFFKSIMKYFALPIPSGMSFRPFINMFMLGPNEYEAREHSIAQKLFPRETKIDNRQYNNVAIGFS